MGNTRAGSNPAVDEMHCNMRAHRVWSYVNLLCVDLSEWLRSWSRNVLSNTLFFSSLRLAFLFLKVALVVGVEGVGLEGVGLEMCSAILFFILATCILVSQGRSCSSLQ